MKPARTMGGIMTTKELGPRELGTTDAEMYRNRARDVSRRIADRRNTGRPPTKDQSRDLARWLGLAEQADNEAMITAGI